MDPIKKFIEENKSAFNDEQPSAAIWSSLNRALGPENVVEDEHNELAIQRNISNKKDSTTRQLKLWKRLSAAAVGLLLLAAGFILGSQNGQVIEGPSLVMADYAETEQYYTQQVSQRMQEVQEYNVDEGVASDIKQLDEVYAELKAELISSDNPNKEIIVDAMIINYQTKLAILERVLENIQESDK